MSQRLKADANVSHTNGQNKRRSPKKATSGGKRESGPPVTHQMWLPPGDRPAAWVTWIHVPQPDITSGYSRGEGGGMPAAVGMRSVGKAFAVREGERTLAIPSYSLLSEVARAGHDGFLLLFTNKGRATKRTAGHC